MSLRVTEEPADEPLSIADAKQHLRYFADDADTEIASLVKAARDDCERETGRTLRGAVTREWTRCEWWCDSVKLPFPPLLTVEEVRYYDADNAEQTLNAANYIVELSTDGWGKLTWAADADQPATYSRPDAITIEFTTGYADAAAMPPSALHAIKVKLSELWGAGTENETKAAVECAKRLLGKFDMTSYA